MIERPYAVVIDGELRTGLELVLEEGEVLEVRPHTGLPEPYVISTAFVNAHSHLEYRGLQGKLSSTEYFPWIREITQAKQEQSLADVKRDCELAARENRRTGVARIAEHSDRPFAAEALANEGIVGAVFQELITFFERESPDEKIAQVLAKLDSQSRRFEGYLLPTPHTAYTVDEKTLRSFKDGPVPFSIHVAESPFENELFESGTGPIAEFYRTNGFEPHVTGKSVVQTLSDWRLAGDWAQFVHCCSVSETDIEILAKQNVRVTHCPRSNVRLKCEPAPVREMLDAGIKVGLGMDSPASSGPIDMFEEIRAALAVSTARGKPLSAEEVWRMATSMGAESMWWEADEPEPRWDIYSGSYTPLIKLHLEGALTTYDLIERGKPEHVEWLTTTPT